MARKLRIEFAGAIYHISSRGDRHEDIFRDNEDRQMFLRTFDDACSKTGWEVFAYCLMPNHFHLVLQTPQPNLVAGMKWFLGTYTARFNRRHQQAGHVFSGRYRSQIISDNGDYFRRTCDFVHLNPIRANLLPAELPLSSFAWSSLPAYLGKVECPTWLRLARLIKDCGLERDALAGHAEFGRRMEELRQVQWSDELAAAHRGWFFGDEESKVELLTRVQPAVGPWHHGQEVHEAAQVKARQIIHMELQNLGWADTELAARRKGDPAKLAIARRLRVETTMTLEWIAQHLHMGARSHLSHLLYWQGRLKAEGRGAKLAKRKKPGQVIRNDTSLPLTDPDAFDTSFD